MRLAKIGLAVALLLLLKFLHSWYSRRHPKQPRQLGGVGGDECPSIRPKVKFAGRKVSRPVEAFLGQARLVEPQRSDEELQRLFPKKFERHSHVVVVTVNVGVDVAEFARVAECFAKSFSPVVVDVVVVDTGGIAGELREPVHAIVWQDDSSASLFAKNVVHKITGKLFQGKTPSGDVLLDEDAAAFNALITPTFTMHVEDSVRYCFDSMRVMFCSGNTTERMHFGQNIDATDEIVVDMFAGIGYFTVPLAMRGHPKVIYALEKNPLSAMFLKLNCHVNGIVGTVQVHCGDNREVTGTTLCGTADRVMMGYIPSCDEFLPRALSFLKRDGGRPKGTIHYHFLARKEKGASVSKASADASRQLGEYVCAGMQICGIREVKSYSVKKFHYVADLVFGAPMLEAASIEGGNGRRGKWGTS